MHPPMTLPGISARPTPNPAEGEWMGVPNLRRQLRLSAGGQRVQGSESRLKPSNKSAAKPATLRRRGVGAGSRCGLWPLLSTGKWLVVFIRFLRTSTFITKPSFNDKSDISPETKIQSQVSLSTITCLRWGEKHHFSLLHPFPNNPFCIDRTEDHPPASSDDSPRNRRRPTPNPAGENGRGCRSLICGDSCDFRPADKGFEDLKPAPRSP
ncbi:hypothetical protein CEXT_665441 [Caerostris extrusa]|uniref:Uncharacterized protein n=1 Tax=Caerostris extrusa TaxID=172846 RepID=A0AAV4WD65_CAEEX|nr:hypothetical protein CEXT_665441 [Caerostris extrusa]